MDSSSTSGSSSKTVSQLSSLKDKEVDFTQDNVASPIDLECVIQAERISKLLDLAIYKTKLALCLPVLMRDRKTLAKILSPQDFEEVSFIFEQYNSLLFSSSLMILNDDIGSREVPLNQRVNPELAHLLCVLNSYKTLKPKIEAMTEKIRSEAGNADLLKRRSVPQGFAYFLELERFRDQMITQMKTSAAEELQAAFKDRKLANSNVELMARIKQYTDSLKEENDSFKKSIHQKTANIAKLRHDLAGLYQTANVALNKRIVDSDRNMVLLTRAHAAKSEVLKEVAVEIRENYDRLVEKDLNDEKNNRLRRRKVETQLLSWIQKYDLEMKTKQSDLDQVTDEFDDEKQLVESLEQKLEEQSKEFVPLMEEKDAEYHAEMTEKLNWFIVEHAARVIQMAWRETVANRAEKAKLRKLQKQQRAAAEAAAKAAEEAAKREAAAAKKAAKEAKMQAAAEKKAAKEAAKEAAKSAKKANEVTEDED